jgi:RNA polymerase sigma-70 factor (ECF subfamily)
MTPAESMSDAELAACVADPVQAQGAFRLLYDRHAESLMAFALARFPAHADDVAQETWARAWRQLNEKGRTMTNLRGWLFTIARNLGTDFHRGPKSAGLDDMDVADRSPGVAENWIQDERRDAMKKCLDTLNKQKPEYGAVVGAFLGGEEVAAASERLGISRANFDQRKKRALDALQDCVERRLP